MSALISASWDFLVINCLDRFQIVRTSFLRVGNEFFALPFPYLYYTPSQSSIVLFCRITLCFFSLALEWIWDRDLIMFCSPNLAGISIHKDTYILLPNPHLY